MSNLKDLISWTIWLFEWLQTLRYNVYYSCFLLSFRTIFTSLWHLINNFFNRQFVSFVRLWNLIFSIWARRALSSWAGVSTFVSSPVQRCVAVDVGQVVEGAHAEQERGSGGASKHAGCHKGGETLEVCCVHCHCCLKTYKQIYDVQCTLRCKKVGQWCSRLSINNEL